MYLNENYYMSGCCIWTAICNGIGWICTEISERTAVVLEPRLLNGRHLHQRPFLPLNGCCIWTVSSKYQQLNVNSDFRSTAMSDWTARLVDPFRIPQVMQCDLELILLSEYRYVNIVKWWYWSLLVWSFICVEAEFWPQMTPFWKNNLPLSLALNSTITQQVQTYRL